MSGLEIMLWVWTAVLALLAGYNVGLWRTAVGGWRFGLLVIAAVELLGAAWLGSWACTIHSIMAFP